MRLATAACPRWRRRRRWRRSPPGTEEVAAGVGEAPEAGSSISNLALVVPPTVVNNRDAEDPAFLACWRSSSSAASIFGAQNLNLKMAGKEFTVASHNLAQCVLKSKIIIPRPSSVPSSVKRPAHWLQSFSLRVNIPMMKGGLMCYLRLNIHMMKGASSAT